MIKNQIKTVLLLGLLTGLLLGIGQLLGGRTGLLIGLVFAIIMNFSSYWFSDKIVLAIYRAKEASKEQYPKLHSIVEEVSLASNLPKPKVYIIPSEASNAFATGRNKKNSVIAVTKGILQLLSKEELKGVIAHEMAHIKNRDILISTIAATIAGVISYIAFMARFTAISGGMGGDRDRGSALQLIALAIVAPLIALIIRLTISRSREYLADETGARIIKNSSPLANALEKLHHSARATPLRFGSEATSHLFIVNPFTRKSLLNLFSTHPDINERIKRLQQLKV